MRRVLLNAATDFAEVTFEQYRKPTRRERFLDEMNRVVPWADLVAAIEPVYSKAGRRRAHAPCPLSATVIQAVGSCGEEGLGRLTCHAAVCGH
jgi:hypothetical protein